MRFLFRMVSLLPIVLSGCAAFAVQPPTPARDMDLRSLDQARPGEHFYLAIFSSEHVGKQPKYTHTWATVLRVTDQGAGKSPSIEHHTISWMPATLEVYPLRFRAERGVNLGLRETITQVALANDEQIAMWGPYECRASLFTRFVVQKRFMESGRIQYQCIDSAGEAGRTGDACNCIHAITDMDPEHGRRQYPLTSYGFAAGLEIARRFRELDVLVSPERTHDFLMPILGLNEYPISRRKDDTIFSPTRAPFIGKR